MDPSTTWKLVAFFAITKDRETSQSDKATTLDPFASNSRK
jgi:hypothetical protein